MSSKNKLFKFKENETFRCLVQPDMEEIFHKDHPLKGRWGEEMFGNDHPIILELGCGKGEYTIALAERHPENNYIGVDIKGARLWKGAKYATEKPLPNVAFLRIRIEFIESLFAQDEVSQIWVTFADPQVHKPRKRLTSELFLSRYRKFLRTADDGSETGTIHLKTDSQLLHESTLEVIQAGGHHLIEADNDIYGSGRAADDEILSVKTFYEQYFLAQGLPITYLRFKLNTDNTDNPEDPEKPEKP